MILVDLIALSGPLIEWKTGSTEEGIYMWQLGLYGMFAAAARWVLRAIWFEYRGSELMLRVGWTPQRLFSESWSARHNRWMFHVDEQGKDRDLDV
ncbi:hypothetical protein [Aliiroseovarius sp. PrR006]|uniref:hypothetical protein n=1 Tax=Aliiroseovarius sp. PrR006 TaxID=2706883 RepID=UPI0013D222E5|nr:hypothetical protein [Aliiroseovarius sp. PrR006]NDW53149.1 hypothetical protein [Aliiroseovarius sp. PrR006]